MLESFEGACQCGAIAYRVYGRQHILFVCHYAQCQRQSSSAFGMALWVEWQERPHFDRHPRVWERQIDTGKSIKCHFCPICGTRLIHESSQYPQYISIKPGTLNRTDGLRPSAHIWTSKAQGWIPTDDRAQSYPRNPPSIEKMVEEARRTRT